MKKTPILLVAGYLLISCMVAVGYNSIQDTEEAVLQAWKPVESVSEPTQAAEIESEPMQTEDDIQPDQTAGVTAPVEADDDDRLILMSGPTQGLQSTPGLTESPKFSDAVTPTTEPTKVPEQNTEDSEDKREEVTYDGKVIGYINTDYRMKEETLQTIVKMIRKEPYISSFVLYDINSDAMICYNEERYYPVASTVKAPFAMTCLWQIEDGTYSLEDTMEYTSDYAINGDGVIKKEDIGTMFTVKELTEHAILVSDDIGYLMLQGKFGHKAYNQFLKDSGNKVTIDGKSVKWGQTSAIDSLRNWKEVYLYINSERDNAAFFAELLKNTNKSFIRNVLGDDYTVYNKMGWVYGQCCHDHAIIMDEQPYLMMIMTMGNARAENQKFMEDLAEILNGVHEEMVSTEEAPAEEENN